MSRDELVAAMTAIETGKAVAMSEELRWGALAGLGSKYLAVGSPDSIGLVQCGSAAAAIAACHALLFGELKVKISGPNLLAATTEATSCGLEEAFACDIVCLPCTIDFDMAWIAEATHLNLRYEAPGPSAGSLLVFQSAAITVESKQGHGLPRRHGSLDQVITGRVSGRMSDELTVLFHD